MIKMESLPLRAAMASLPIIMALLLMILYQYPASKAMPPSWFLAVILAALLWRMPLIYIGAATLEGILLSLSILIIVFGAILLLNTLKVSGSLQSISYTFGRISLDRRVQALLLGFGFATLIEGASGFGTPAALVAPLLVGIGFPPLAAAMTALIGHSPAVSFGAVGTPVLVGISSSLDLPEIQKALTLPFSEWIRSDMTIWNATFHFIGGALVIPLLVVFYLAYFFGEKRDFRSALSIWPLALVSGLVFAVTQNSVARLLGPEIPSLLGGLMVMITIIILSRLGVLLPKETWSFPNEKAWKGERGKVPMVKAFTPYLVIIVLLVSTRIYPPFMDFIRGPAIAWSRILGTPISWRWTWLNNPGIFPFILVSVISWPLLGMKKREIKEALSTTFSQIVPATIAMCSAVAMAQVMMRSSYNLLELESMLISLAQASARIFAGAFPLISPWIGILGSFISGSNTVSNILFSPYQYSVASELNLSRTIMVALQSTGAAVGNMIAIHNVVAVLTVVGCLGKEGLVIKRNLLAVAIYALLTGFLGWIALRIYPYLF